MGGAAGKGGGIDPRYAFGQGNGAQGGAGKKTIDWYCGNARGYGNRGNTRIPERAIPQTGKACGEIRRSQRGAIVKGVNADGGKARREGNGDER